MTDLMQRVNMSWEDLKDLEFHVFRSIYQSISDSLKALIGKNK